MILGEVSTISGIQLTNDPNTEFDYPVDVISGQQGKVLFTVDARRVIVEYNPSPKEVTIFSGGLEQQYNSSYDTTYANTRFWTITGLNYNSAGDLYVTDFGASVIVVLKNGISTIAAGQQYTLGLADGNALTTATLSYPNFLLMDSTDDIYFTDLDYSSSIYKIRKFSTSASNNVHIFIQ